MANFGYTVAPIPALTPEQRQSQGINDRGNPDLLFEGRVFDVESTGAQGPCERRHPQHRSLSESPAMSSSFLLAFDRRPAELLQGMDRTSTDLCRFFGTELGFPQFERATPYCLAWISGIPGVIATVMYLEDSLGRSFQRLTGVAGHLSVSLDLDKRAPLGDSMSIIFSIAHAVLSHTEWDAAFCKDWECVVLRRIRGKVYLEDIPHGFIAGDTEPLLRQLDPLGRAQRGFRPAV